MSSTRRNLCGLLFWTKAVLSLFFVIGILILYFIELIELRNIAIEQKKLKATPILFGAGQVECSSTRSELAKLEPPAGFSFYGFSLRFINGNFPTSTIPLFGGRRAALFNAFYQFDSTKTPPYDYNLMTHQAEECALMNAVLQISMDPNVNPSNIPSSALIILADHLQKINSELGVPVLLRWGHEMNGYWYAYGGKPLSYVDSFRRLSVLIKERTNVTALVWAPNVGIQYPYGGATAPGSFYPSATRDVAEFNALDTNKNGVLDFGDDPYGPYYPGDAYVDWVGLSLYHYPTNGVNSVPLNNQAQSWIDGSAASGSNTDLYNFYERFSANSGKPFIIAESGSPLIVTANAGPGELAIKQAWWRQTLKLHEKFPNLKAIINFEESKSDGATQGGDTRDFRTILAVDPTIVSAFVRDFANHDDRILMSDQISYGCDGSIVLRN